MKGIKTVILFFLIAVLSPCGALFSQPGTSEGLVSPPNPFEFYPQPSYSVSQGKKYNESSFYSHPDFGKMTFDSPYGKNVVEDISKRTLDERHYVDLTDPTFFYIEKSSVPINFYYNGHLRAIDPSLHFVSDGFYRSGLQPVPTVLDVNQQKSEFLLNHDHFGFNNVSLKLIHFDNSESTYAADWSDISVGNFGAYITEIFPGIDMKITYDQASVKSEFIVKQNLNVKEIIFVDHLQLPANYEAIIDENDLTTRLFVQINNVETNETQIVFSPATSYDASGLKQAWLSSYFLDGDNLEIKCDSGFINNSAVVYPLIIDPLVTVVGPIASPGALMGSLLTPAFCSNNITVVYPGGTTPWDVQATWNLAADFCVETLFLFGFFDPCWVSDGQVWLTSACGGASPVGAPGIVWICPGCNFSGTWNPTLPFASDGTQSLAQCFAPSCVNQNLTFTLNDNRTYCNSFAGFDDCVWANAYCVYINQWTVTVQGRTVETLGNTVTGNGSATYNDPDCLGTQVLNPTPLYGVPGYTYVWSNGATTPTITVPVTPAVFTVTVTDACGTSVVATFNIGCPLPIRLNYFEAKLENENVELEWETLSEINSDYFIVQRADKSGNFYDLFKVDANENSSESILYKTTDENPLNGLSYYRLKMVDMDGAIEYSDIKSVLINPEESTLYIIPNPSNGLVELVYSSAFSGDATIQIYSTGGQLLQSENITLTVGAQSIPVDCRDLPKGVYLFTLTTSGEVMTEKLIIN